MSFDFLHRIQSMKTSVAITLLLVIMCLVSLEFAMSSRRQLNALTSKASQNETQIEQYRSSIHTLTGQSASALAQERAALPNTLSIPDVLTETNTVAAGAHVTLSSFQFNPMMKASQNNGALIEPNVQPYVVNVTATGSRAHILAFIAGLESYRRFTTVQTVSYQEVARERHGRPASQSATITFDIYTDP